MEKEKIKLWEGGTPGFIEEYGQDEPSITTYLLDGGKDNTCIIVCPGGAYAGKAAHECGVVAEKLNKMGVSAVTLDYRVRPYKYPYITEDLLRAVRYLRHNSEKFNISPDKIGVLGFSAGGHLAASAMTCFDYGKAGDAVDAVSSRPDFAVLCYPVVSFNRYTHLGSRNNLIKGLPEQEKLIEKLSAELNIKEDTPPAFIWHTMDDAGVDSRNSLELAMAMRAQNIPCELHIFQHGHHGVGLAENYHNVWQWTHLLKEWLKENKLM